MQRERGGGNDFFSSGDPFSRFRGFGMMPSLFGGRDPFDDPFFTSPFGRNPESSRFDTPSFATGGASRVNREKGVVIEELGPEDEIDNGDSGDKNDQRNHSGSSKEPSVKHPDDEEDDDGAETKARNANKRSQSAEGEPQARKFSFHTSKVTYGGADGAYYTSTRSRRTGSNGVVIEESKEADATTGQATHRISKGIHDKGHSVTRKLNSNGKVDTTQTLHNLHEDELAGFEEAWMGNFKASLPGRSNKFGSGGNAHQGTTTNEGWGFPSIGQAPNAIVKRSDIEARSNSSAPRTKKVVRIDIE